MKRLFEAKEYNPAVKRKPNPKSDETVEHEVKIILGKLPKGEDEWTYGELRREEDVAATFAKLTLQHHSQVIKEMDCLKILEELVRVLDPECGMHVAFLGAACELLMRQGVLKGYDATPLTKASNRAAASNYIRFSDMLYQHQVLGDRAYEFLLQCKKCLSALGHFKAEHFKIVDKILSSDHGIYKPKKSLDSTYLRFPTLLHVLFAGKFT
ncbi:hypothetical protein AK830_g4110 [Neonectria ditissima]|uniref:Uncharacterized protein n=1 Tax=Neonectria ditissima TaxID=78410 RepID=A0A0P7BP54_9HYPO|nr:hypothetical protein AK830_g4110 [Neonectria ditissima]